MALILRQDKGLPLTYAEGDANLQYLETLASSPRAPVEDFESSEIVTSSTGLLNTAMSSTGGSYANVIALWPFHIGINITVSRVWVNVISTNSSNNIKFLFFDKDASSFRPANRIGISAAFAMSTAGHRSSLLAANMVLEAGKVYWGGYISSTTGGAISGKTHGDFGCLRVNFASGSHAYYYGLTMASSYTSPDETYTFSAWPTNGITGTPVPRLMFNDVS